jgi:hypothetical protein
MLASGVWGAEPAWSWKPTHLDLLPTPKECASTGREFPVPRDATVVVVARPGSAIRRTAVQTLADFFQRRGFRHLKTAEVAPAVAARLTILLDRPPTATVAGGEDRGAAQRPRPQGYVLRTRYEPGAQGGVVADVTGGDDAGTLYGVYTFLKTLRPTPQGVAVREVRIADQPALSARGISPQWAWYIGDRGPYDAALWGLDRWKTTLDLMTEYRLNVLALCTYGKFPFPLERYRSRCAVDLPFEVWSPQQGRHTIRWTHPAYTHDFLGELVEYAHARGIRVLIYSCLNLQDEIGSRQWANEAEIAAYVEIQQHLLRRYGIDGFLFESLESLITHPADRAQFGTDQWARLRADVFLTRRYSEAIRAVQPAATIGLIDHYLFRDWDTNHVPQRAGLTRWKSELPPETRVAYVHSPEAYDVFPPERIWTYVFGPRGMPKPALQIDLADFCDVPRTKQAAGAYYVTYDWTPHEVNYLCFAESAWGNYGGADRDALTLHWEGRGVGGPLSRRVWNGIQRDFYGDRGSFGEGLRTAASAVSLGEPAEVLRHLLQQEMVPALDAQDFAAAEELVARIERQKAITAAGLARMRADAGVATPTMITRYDIREHLDKALLLAQVQWTWLDFCCRYLRAAVDLARQVDTAAPSRNTLDELRAAARTAHASIRDALARAYFSYPHDVLGKYEFLAADGPFLQDLERLPLRLALGVAGAGKRLRLRNVAATAKASADSSYRAGFYDPANTVDGKQGTPSGGIWVAAETAMPHHLTLQLASAPRLRGIVVHWPRDAARDWVAQDFAVEIHDGGQWRRLSQQRENRQLLTVLKFNPTVRADQLRIEITRGSPSRPRLAAISEVELLAIEE